MTTSSSGAGPAAGAARPAGGHSVTVDRVARRFGDVVAVDRVSLEVPAGEFLSILGPSGCGKTTLLRIVAGLEHADEGRILIDGQDVTRVPAHRRPTNLVFQRGALFPHKTVFENVAYPLQRKRQRGRELREGVEEALALVRLATLGDRYPSELSGGQAQRVALARALVSKPAVLLLDEPLAALDLALRKEMQLELRRLQERLGTTFVFVTHDQEEALTMSSRIVVMRDGRIVQIGTPQEIYDHPTSVFASTFIGESNLLVGEVVEWSDGVAAARIGEHVFRADAPQALERGERVALSVRPERVRVTAGPVAEDGWTPVTGTVAEVLFLGNRVRARVACSGTSLWVEQPPGTPGADALREGSVAFVGWPAEDARLLRPEESPSSPASSG